MEFHHVGQAGLELLTSSNPPTSSSQSPGITGVSHRAGPLSFFYSQGLVPRLECSGMIQAHRNCSHDLQAQAILPTQTPE